MTFTTSSQELSVLGYTLVASTATMFILFHHRTFKVQRLGQILNLAFISFKLTVLNGHVSLQVLPNMSLTTLVILYQFVQFSSADPLLKE